MIKALISAAAALIIIIVGLTVYLGPDDLSSCGNEPVATNSACAPADAIVAVSGGDTLARTDEAIKLYQNGWAPKLIFSGAAEDKSGPSNAAVMRREALAAGVPEQNILVEEYSTTTKQNAENTQSLFEQNGIKSVILVTSGYHERRAGLEFSTRSASVLVRDHPVAHDDQWSAFWWLTPVGWYLAVGEFVKIILFYVGVTR
ncbi:MAG TPA: YdcF family protein [Candidatus Chromulinivoraceae bacterium]|nr:YdcF family protein [Candidatus Chromulinivoraceae bacterium]